MWFCWFPLARQFSSLSPSFSFLLRSPSFLVLSHFLSVCLFSFVLFSTSHIVKLTIPNVKRHTRPYTFFLQYKDYHMQIDIKECAYRIYVCIQASWLIINHCFVLRIKAVRFIGRINAYMFNVFMLFLRCCKFLSNWIYFSRNVIKYYVHVRVRLQNVIIVIFLFNEQN